MKNLIIKTLSFVVPSLAAAGAFGAEPDGGVQTQNQLIETDGLLNKAKSIVSDIKKRQIYTLAQHSSHSSHSSHGSHSSHSSHASGGARSLSIDDIDAQDILAGRNESSTPRNTVLPSSRIVVEEERKLKILPGNSDKFTKIVLSAQLALAAKGYNVGAIDGSLHARSIAAVFEYQNDNAILASGKLDTDTLSSLGIVAE